MKYIILALVSTAILSFNAKAQSNPIETRDGFYEIVDLCHVTTTHKDDGLIEVRVDRGFQSGSITFDPVTKEVKSLGACNDPMSIHKQKITQSVSFMAPFWVIIANCGGQTQAFDYHVTILIDQLYKEKEVVAFRAISKVAKYGLPNGMHSGPIKATTASFQCGLGK